MPASRPKRRASAFKGPRLKTQARDVLQRLSHEYPGAHCALDFTNPYELLVATILSAQCTDKRVNMVTPALFKNYPTPGTLALAAQPDVEALIRSTGFFHNKAKNLIGMARGVVNNHGGVIPDTMDELTRLPGVGRKTANVILGNAFNKNEGIVVDTHVTRLSQRLGLTRETDAVKIEHSLIPLFPRDRWTVLSHLLVEHGRKICVARTPKCADCVLSDICPSSTEITPPPPHRRRIA